MNKLISITVIAAMAAVTLAADTTDKETLARTVSGDGPTVLQLDVKVARAYAFAFNRTVERIDLPELETPGAMLFNGCAKLRAVSMPSVEDTPETERALIGAFGGCVSLETVDLSGIEYKRSNLKLPLGVPTANKTVRFHFKDGIFDVNGKAVEE